MRRSAPFTAGLLALVFALAASPAAMAQVTGLYFKEVEKDGRIYVFNTPERYKSWTDSGEIGTAITLTGRRPQRRDASWPRTRPPLDLYFFKHNLPGYDRPTPKPARAGLHRRLEGRQDHHRDQVSPAGHLQPRCRSATPRRCRRSSDDVGSFRIRRMKTKFEGWVYTKDLTYELQLNWRRHRQPARGRQRQLRLHQGQEGVPCSRPASTRCPSAARS